MKIIATKFLNRVKRCVCALVWRVEIKTIMAIMLCIHSTAN